MSDNQQQPTTVIHEHTSSAGWVLAFILLVLIAVGGWYAYHYLNTKPSESEVNIEVDLPNDVMPSNQ